MTLNENTGGEITLAEAKNFIKAFKSRFPDEITAAFVGSVNVKLILEQQGCMGIRIYNGYDEVENRMNFVLVGVDNNGKDMTSGIILDRMGFCPIVCDETSELFK